MSSFSYFKIQSEIPNITKIEGETFDFTDSFIIHFDKELYDYQFEQLLLDYGKPINTYAGCWDFLTWLRVKKDIKADTVEFNWIENHSELVARIERGKPKTKMVNGKRVSIKA